MDGYTIGILIKGLLASAGLKATLAIIAVGGVVVAVLRALRFLAGFLEKMQESRDRLMSDTMRRIAEQDERSEGHRVELAKVLERINGNAAVAMEEARDTRKEMHQRFNKMQEDVTTIRGAVS